MSSLGFTGLLTTLLFILYALGIAIILGLAILAIYTMILLIKALRIYIKKNS